MRWIDQIRRYVVAVTDADIEFVADLFSQAGTITTRKMLGGLSIYCDGEIFSIMTSEGKLMLKAQGPLALELENLRRTSWQES